MTEQFAASDVQRWLLEGQRLDVGGYFYHEGFAWQIVDMDKLGNINARCTGIPKRLAELVASMKEPDPYFDLTDEQLEGCMIFTDENGD